MTVEQSPTQLVAAFFRTLDRHDWAGLRALCSPAYVHHAPRVPAADLATYLETLGRMYAAFPDMVTTVEQTVAQGEYVATRYTARGTHRGDFYGVPASGRPVALHAIAIQHVVDGAIIEGWFAFDTAEIYAQIQPEGSAERVRS